MKLVKSTRLSKKTIIIIGAILGLVLVSALGWFLFANKATSDYRTQLGSSVAGIKKELTEQAAPFEAVVKEGNSAESMALLRKLEDSLQQKINELPATPSLWGMNIAQQQDMQRRDELVKAIHTLKTDISQSRELLVYGHDAATVLQVLTTQTGANAEQQKALADSWQSVIGKLKAIVPPPAAESVHTQILQAATKVQASLVGLPDLFTKKDIPGFAAKQKEAQAAIAEFRTLGLAITALHETADKNIQAHYVQLSRLLY